MMFFDSHPIETGSECAQLVTAALSSAPPSMQSFSGDSSQIQAHTMTPYLRAKCSVLDSMRGDSQPLPLARNPTFHYSATMFLIGQMRLAPVFKIFRWISQR